MNVEGVNEAAIKYEERKRVEPVKKKKKEKDSDDSSSSSSIE